MYYLLYQVDNLNAAIETAKRILTKEKIDKQKTGQSSATPFMKASQEKSKKNEKGVSFGTIETKETMKRHSNSIDMLTSLVNKLDMKLYRKEVQYRSAVYQNRNRGHGQRQNNNYRYRNRSYSRDRGQSYNNIIGRGNFYPKKIIDPTIELEVGQEMTMSMEMDIEGMIDMTVDQIIEEAIIGKIRETKGKE